MTYTDCFNDDDFYYDLYQRPRNNELELMTSIYTDDFDDEDFSDFQDDNFNDDDEIH